MKSRSCEHWLAVENFLGCKLPCGISLRVLEFRIFLGLGMGVGLWSGGLLPGGVCGLLASLVVAARAGSSAPGLLRRTSRAGVAWLGDAVRRA